jgi:hypothetical protein
MQQKEPIRTFGKKEKIKERELSVVVATAIFTTKERRPSKNRSSHRELRAPDFMSSSP